MEVESDVKRRRPRSWVAREEPSSRGSRGRSRACAPRLRRREMPDRELERELRELGTLIDYPPTPDVAYAARNLLDEEDSRPQRFRMPFPRMRWAAVAAAFVLAAAVPTLSPSLRTTVSDWFVAEHFQSAGRPAVDAGSSERQSEAGAPPLASPRVAYLRHWLHGSRGSRSACVRRGPEWMARSSCPGCRS
jgi:hypothetical protein